MAITYENVTPSLIENTTMQKRLLDGVHKQYLITPNENYVLHDTYCDSYAEYDENGNGIGEAILGFYSGTRTVAASYDFTANPRQFYAVLRTEVPEGSGIFSVPNETEIM